MDEKIRETIARFCHDYPDEVAETLLDTAFWINKVVPTESYSRFDDDTRHGHISVVFTRDADAWVEVLSEQDPEDPFSHRFRMPFFGGGESKRVRTAILLLALAIKLDNEEHPQHRPPRSS